MAEPTGFEPATFCVTGRYANRYTTAPRTEEGTDAGANCQPSGAVQTPPREARSSTTPTSTITPTQRLASNARSASAAPRCATKRC